MNISLYNCDLPTGHSGQYTGSAGFISAHATGGMDSWKKVFPEPPPPKKAFRARRTCYDSPSRFVPKLSITTSRRRGYVRRKSKRRAHPAHGRQVAGGRGGDPGQRGDHGPGGRLVGSGLAGPWGGDFRVGEVYGVVGDLRGGIGMPPIPLYSGNLYLTYLTGNLLINSWLVFA